jgi:hypothetical protein
MIALINEDQVMDINEIIAFYGTLDRRGKPMLFFLNTISDLFPIAGLYWSPSLDRLCISRFENYSERNQHPSLVISVDYSDNTDVTEMMTIEYHEGWSDGPLFRFRHEGIRCPIENGRAPFLEQINRIKHES